MDIKKKKPYTRCIYCKKYIHKPTSSCPHCKIDIDRQFSGFDLSVVKDFVNGKRDGIYDK